MQYSSSLIFDPSEDTAIHWAARTGLEHALDLRTAEQLYARALPYLKTWAWALATKHGWTQEAVDNVGDMPLAVCLGRDELIQGVDGDLSYVARLVLPLNFSDFLNPEFTHDWAVMFSHLTTFHQSTDYSADIFQLGRAGIPRPLQNILYLLQILSPGLLLVRSVTSDDEDDDGQWGAQGIDLVALPPSIWVGLHIEDLEDIFGAQAAVKLYQAAEDPYCASEDASSAGTSYGSSLDATSDFYYYSSDSSAGLTSDDYSDPEDWAASADFDDLPEFEQQQQDDSFVQFDPSQQVDHFIQAPAAALDNFASRELEYHDHGHYVGHPDKQQEPPLISDDVGKASNIMEGYRHCDSDCAYCGLCSRRFAESLTQRLLMQGAIFAI